MDYQSLYHRTGLFRVHARGASGRAGETRKQRGLLRLWIEYFIALLELRALLTWRRHTISLRARAVTHTPLQSCHVPMILVIFFFFQPSFNPLQARVSLSSLWKSLYRTRRVKIEYLYFLYIETFVRGIDQISMENRESKKNLEAVVWRKKCNCQFVTIDRPVVAKRSNRGIAKIRYANDSCWECAYI